MISARSWIAAALTAASLTLAGPTAGLAQEPKPATPAGDDPLDKLLDKLEAKDKADDKKTEDAKKPDDKKTEDAKKPDDKKTGEPAPAKPTEEGFEKLLEKLEAKDKAADQAKGMPGGKKPGEVAPSDKDLDKILEGLGQTKETPSPDDKKPDGPGSDGPPPPSGEKPKPDDLKGGEKSLDQRLEELTGKKPKPKDQRQRKPEDETGPLGQVIKEMRDVEERLGKTDTGEETRKKQGEIVKNLDELIEKMKNAPSQSMAMKMMREGNQPGQQPKPGQPGQQPGAMAQGAQATKPPKPEKGAVSSDLAKSIWGNLPVQFREEMGNVLNERALPSKEDLIRLYYLSLGNKGSNKGD
jgi:hypothetical protein